VLLKLVVVGLLENDPELFYKLKCNCQCEILHIKNQRQHLRKLGAPVHRKAMNSFEVAPRDLITDLQCVCVCVMCLYIYTCTEFSSSLRTVCASSAFTLMSSSTKGIGIFSGISLISQI